MSRRWMIVALAPLVALLSVVPARAGTTGALSGRVADGASQAPLAGARVMVAGPAGSATAVTDKNGAFAFLSLAPDTYALGVAMPGFETAAVSGITVQADQTVTYAVTLARAPAPIGQTRSRANASLVQPGISTDVYTVSALQQRAAAALGGGGGLNNAYSAIASVPGVFVPQGQFGTYQSVFVRGANYTQVGYEYDGVPIQRAFDQYPGGNLSSLGQQEVQLYAGGAPTGTGSTALAGFINQVVRTGTFPGFAHAALGTGSPAQYGSVRVEGGGAAPDRSFTYYAGLGGYEQGIAYERGDAYDQSHGGLLDLYKSNCSSAAAAGNHPTAGCYRNTAYGGIPLGPNGYELGPAFWGAPVYLTDRDDVVNLHFGIPHARRRDGGRDDVQVLFDTTLVQTYFATAPSDWGPAFQDAIVNGTFSGRPPCGNATATNCNKNGAQPGVYNDKIVYGGPVGSFLSAGNLGDTRISLFPGSPANRPFGAPQDPFERDNFQQSSAIVKLQYQRNISPSSYARLYAYTQYSDWLQYGEGGLNPLFYGAIPSDNKIGAHTRGAGFNYVNQLGAKHLLSFTASYTTATTFRNNNAAIALSNATTAAGSNAVAFLVDSTNPAAGVCYAFPPAAPANPRPQPVATSCAAATVARYVLPAAPLGPNAGAAPPLISSGANLPAGFGVGSAGGFTCGRGPCAYYTVANGQAAIYNTVRPKFTALALADKLQLGAKLSLDLGLRYDDFRYQLAPTEGGPARAFWVSFFNRFNCYDPVAQQLVTTNPATGAALDLVNRSCASFGLQPVGFSAHSAAQEDYPELQPRFGASYTVNRTNVVRFSAGKYAQPASTAYQQFDTVQPNFIALNQPFYATGFRSPDHRVYPEESYNVDASWEHQFGVGAGDASFKLTPFLRTTKNELRSMPQDAKSSNVVSAINVGRKSVKGVELALQKGDLARDGLYGALSYTYTFARVRFDRFGNGTTNVTALNNAVAQYNAYTKYCTLTNPADARCRVDTGTATYLAGVTSRPSAPPGSYTTTGAAACFTPAGAPDPSCAAGSIANPYWNMPVQDLYDPGDLYPAYNAYSGGARGNGSNQTYVAPHVLALIGNYKRGPFSITPTVQFQGGAQYG
ncbi:MAG TPA: TonB-dependent receptor, partial [Candidatus Elarobacter sp.]|nr:TonB-dependent receptor [Candidatus Elarobacter sp.]